MVYVRVRILACVKIHSVVRLKNGGRSPDCLSTDHSPNRASPNLPSPPGGTNVARHREFGTVFVSVRARVKRDMFSICRLTATLAMLSVQWPPCLWYWLVILSKPTATTRLSRRGGARTYGSKERAGRSRKLQEEPRRKPSFMFVAGLQTPRNGLRRA